MERKTLSENLIREISALKKEPIWMLDFRLKAFKKFLELENPDFGPKININFDEICYYKKSEESTSNWKDVDENIKDEFDALGVIDAEEKYLDGVNNQYDSNTIYHNLKVNNPGVIFLSTDDALKKHPDLFKEYFNTLVKYDENKYTALNGALWSGGSFIYIPPKVRLDRPLQSYFRINEESLGQFERTIIIVDEESELSYIEGCTATSYSKTSLHAGVVEIFVKKNAKCKYSTIQNWSTDVINLVTKRSLVLENALMEWIDGNIGSKITMKYPSCILKGDNSVGNSVSIAYAKDKQFIDSGAKMIHIGKNTKSKIIAKSIAASNGRSNYRGTVRITAAATNAVASIKCDTILLDKTAKSDTYPENIVENNSSILEHEATVSKVSVDKLHYLMKKGLSEDKAAELLVMGFMSDFKKELPMEYAVELNRLIKEI